MSGHSPGPSVRAARIAKFAILGAVLGAMHAWTASRGSIINADTPGQTCGILLAMPFAVFWGIRTCWGLKRLRPDGTVERAPALFRVAGGALLGNIVGSVVGGGLGWLAWTMVDTAAPLTWPLIGLGTALGIAFALLLPVPAGSPT